MPTLNKDTQLIERAALLAGSQNKLAKMLEMDSPSLTQIKHGKRPMNWRTRGRLRVFTGEKPAHAFMAAIADELEDSEEETEKKAALELRAALADVQQVSSWRKR